MDISKPNQILLDVADQYLHITYQNIVVPVPYFINTAEQIYKQVMGNVGIESDKVNSAITTIKEGKTPLGSTGGKGSPQEITRDLERLMVYLDELGYHPTSEMHVRSWMAEMHVGLDCAGYIYNILLEVQNQTGVNIIDKLAWKDVTNKRPSHAGAFIFDAIQLEQVDDYRNLKPLDILIFDDHTHVGILCDYKNGLYLTDCSMGKNGISFSKLVWQGNDLIIENSESWTKVLNGKKITVRRVDFNPLKLV